MKYLLAESCAIKIFLYGVLSVVFASMFYKLMAYLYVDVKDVLNLFRWNCPLII